MQIQTPCMWLLSCLFCAFTFAESIQLNRPGWGHIQIESKNKLLKYTGLVQLDKKYVGVGSVRKVKLGDGSWALASLTAAPKENGGREIFDPIYHLIKGPNQAILERNLGDELTRLNGGKPIYWWHFWDNKTSERSFYEGFHEWYVPGGLIVLGRDHLLYRKKRRNPWHFEIEIDTGNIVRFGRDYTIDYPHFGKIIERKNRILYRPLRKVFPDGTFMDFEYTVDNKYVAFHNSPKNDFPKYEINPRDFIGSHLWLDKRDVLVIDNNNFVVKRPANDQLIHVQIEGEAAKRTAHSSVVAKDIRIQGHKLLGAISLDGHQLIAFMPMKAKRPHFEGEIIFFNMTSKKFMKHRQLIYTRGLNKVLVLDEKVVFSYYVKAPAVYESIDFSENDWNSWRLSELKDSFEAVYSNKMDFVPVELKGLKGPTERHIDIPRWFVKGKGDNETELKLINRMSGQEAEILKVSLNPKFGRSYTWKVLSLGNKRHVLIGSYDYGEGYSHSFMTTKNAIFIYFEET